MAENKKIEFNKDALFGFVLAYSANDSTPETTHENLMAVTGVEAMTLEEIKEQFERIKAGDWSLVKKEPAPSSKTLSGVLSVGPVADNVFQHFNLKDRLILRKVSQDLKNLVREQPFKIEELKIRTVEPNRMSIDADGFKIEYLDVPAWIDNGRRHLIRKGDEIKFVDGQSLESMVVNEARSILDCEKLTIGEFSTTLNLMKYFEPIIDRKIRFRIQRLKVSVGSMEELRYALSIADINFIEEIWIDKQETRQIHDIDIVSNYKLQWKKAAVLVSEMLFETYAFVKHFGHFDYLCFVLDGQRISLGVLEKLKDTLLLRPTVQQIKIIPAQNHPSNDPIFLIPPASFRAFQDPNNPKKFIFPYANSTNVLTFKIAYNGIVFRGPCYKAWRDKIHSTDWKRGMVENEPVLVESPDMYADQPYEFRQD